MSAKNQLGLSLQQAALFALATAVAMLILFLSIWVTTNRPVRLRIMGKTCPEYPPAPTGCSYGITTSTDKNGCLVITCFQPKFSPKPK